MASPVSQLQYTTGIDYLTQMKMPRQFQFVAVSNPTGPVPSESRKLSHAHVTREAHAKARRLRVQKYRNEMMQSRTEPLVDAETPSPLVRIPKRCESLFSASAPSLSSQEHFLLDHCTSLTVSLHLA